MAILSMKNRRLFFGELSQTFFKWKKFTLKATKNREHFFLSRQSTTKTKVDLVDKMGDTFDVVWEQNVYFLSLRKNGDANEMPGSWLNENEKSCGKFLSYVR